jgi:hypothetical protein
VENDTMTPQSLFGSDFDSAHIAQIEHGMRAQNQAEGQARAMRKASRIQTRRATAEKRLAEILPARFEAGDSWHVLSHGDIDSLSYLRHALTGVTHFDHVLLSTWCIAKADLDEIASWIDAGKIDQFDLYAGEIFPSQYGDEYEQALAMAETYGCRIVIAKNHSKITLAENVAEEYRLVVESSANVNTNPRIEQSAIHCSDELHAFYKEFFHGLRSIDKYSARAAL